jgi:Protein of unknown function (DUF998)
MRKVPLDHHHIIDGPGRGRAGVLRGGAAGVAGSWQRYGGLCHEACALDLRQFDTWCTPRAACGERDDGCGAASGGQRPGRIREGAPRAVRLGKLAASGGVAGPLLFTAAWVVSSLRQAGLPAAGVQLSGLAAQDARDPQIMIAAFVLLGACTIGFGMAVRTVAGPRSAGPWLVVAAGAAAVAAGVFRRDHMLLAGPGFAGESWHNQVHDVASGVAYAAMLAAPLVLARRFRADPQWAVLAGPVQLLALASAAAIAVFASRGVEPWNGVVQRAAVTLALAAEALAAARMLTLPKAGTGPPARPAASPGHRPATTR